MAKATFRPLRIAVVVPKYGLVGGGEKFVFELTERIAQNRRFQIHVFANQWRMGSEAVQFHRVPILKFPRFAAPLSFAAFARKKINQSAVDLIHTHERIFDAHIYSVHGIPHSIWIKQIRAKRHMSLFDHSLAYVERRLVNNPNCKRLLAVSSITAEKLQQAFGDLTDRLSIVPPGVDLAPFARWSKQDCRRALRKQFGWSNKDRILLFVGMNFEVKGLDRMIEAVSYFRGAWTTGSIRLLVVGKGNIRKYQQMAVGLGVADRVAFAGPVDNGLERYYLGSDVLLLLSKFDTFGMVVLEAMAAGLPVIISPSVGARDVVRQGWNGYVVDPGQIQRVSHHIVLALDPRNHSTMAANARTTAERHCWDNLARDILRLYCELLQCDAAKDPLKE